jgi:A/G-specific adenine glycosylase
MKNKHTFFTNHLMEWFAQNHRPLPWKGEKNPYFVWLSEIILQQTRVEQGLPYFERFKAKYPTVTDLANAPEDEVMKLWEGLGYYSRARNLHFTAKMIAHDMDGKFPDTYDEILKLKGVGTYTAAAIASFAYDLPHAVVDGNVYRVLARVFGIETAIDSTVGKKEFAALAQQLIEEKRAADYNQAIMDFGATHCTPKNPKCKICPMAAECFAFQNKKIADLPFKEKKVKKRDRFFNYFIFNQNGIVYIQKRTEKDIWQNLYEFPILETTKIIDEEDLFKMKTWQMWTSVSDCKIEKISKPYKQLLTHQKIVAQFWEIEITGELLLTNAAIMTVKRENLTKFAFPKVIDTYLKDKNNVLELF